jgi:uncharacterized protein YraI
MARKPSGPKPFRQLSLAAIATLIGLLALAPAGAFEILPDKNLTGGSVRTGPGTAMLHVGTPEKAGVG